MKLKVTQIKSTIARPKTQEATLKAIGLGKIGNSKIYTLNDCISGQIKKIAHLVKTEEVK